MEFDDPKGILAWAYLPQPPDPAAERDGDMPPKPEDNPCEAWKARHRKSPCDECPFGRKAKVKTLGGSTVETYIGQLHGPFWLPCHTDPNYADKASDPEIVSQCAGAAIFRANLGLSDKLPTMLNTCQKDAELSFTSLEDFVKHHTGESRAITDRDILEHLRAEMTEVVGETLAENWLMERWIMERSNED